MNAKEFVQSTTFFVENYRRKSIQGAQKAISCVGCGSFWEFEIQVKVVLVCCVLRNCLRGIDPNY